MLARARAWAHCAHASVVAPQCEQPAAATALTGKACAPGHASGRSGAIGNAAEARSPRDPRPCRATPDAAKGAMSEPLATKTVALRGLWLRQQKPTGRHTDGTCAARAVQPGKRRSYDRDPPLAHQQTGWGHPVLQRHRNHTTHVACRTMASPRGVLSGTRGELLIVVQLRRYKLRR